MAPSSPKQKIQEGLCCGPIVKIVGCCVICCKEPISAKCSIGGAEGVILPNEKNEPGYGVGATLGRAITIKCDSFLRLVIAIRLDEIDTPIQ